MPAELRTLLDSRAETAGMSVECVHPEHEIRFDAHGGEPRNADLAFVGRIGRERVAVTIEAKADESYGMTVAKTACDALERRSKNRRSKGIERVADLAASLLPPWTKGLPRIDKLYYQLLTAVAGTLAYAVQNETAAAVLVVHEFWTDETHDSRHARNAESYQAFLSRFCGHAIPLSDLDRLLGPFRAGEGSQFAEAPPLLIGKIVTNRRGKSAGATTARGT